MDNVTIRSAFKKDFLEIARLQTASWQSAYRNHLPARYLDHQLSQDLEDEWTRHKIVPDDLFLVATDDTAAHILGFIFVDCQRQAFIDHLHVHPDLRNQGIGRALLLHTFERLKERGFVSASLTVLAGNDGAKRFYLRYGGRLLGVRREQIAGYPLDVEAIGWDKL